MATNNKRGPSGKGQTKVDHSSSDPSKHVRTREGVTPGGRQYKASWRADGAKFTSVVGPRSAGKGTAEHAKLTMTSGRVVKIKTERGPKGREVLQTNFKKGPTTKVKK